MKKLILGELYSDEELEAYGVKRTKANDGLSVYEMPCAVCGRTTRTRSFFPTKIAKCSFCRGEIEQKRIKKIAAAKKQHEEKMAEEIGIDRVHYSRFEKGVSKFGLEYLPAIERAEQAIEKFESVPEVVACIELLHNGVRVIPHQAVGTYTVDFCLPDEKVVVEIDGSIYHANPDREYRRDYAITNMLGSDWIIRHIPSDLVMKNHEAFGRNMKRMLDDRRFELNVKR